MRLSAGRRQTLALTLVVLALFAVTAPVPAVALAPSGTDQTDSRELAIPSGGTAPETVPNEATGTAFQSTETGQGNTTDGNGTGEESDESEPTSGLPTLSLSVAFALLVVFVALFSWYRNDDEQNEE